MAKRKRKPKREPPTPAEMKEFMDEHLPYEIDALQKTYRLIQGGRISTAPLAGLSVEEVTRVMSNSLIESFCIHARNLIEFFTEKQNCDFRPKSFTKDGYKVESGSITIMKKSYEKLCAQIAHLQTGRTKNDREKIGPLERKEIFDVLQMEIKRFKKHLQKEWARVCSFDAVDETIEISSAATQALPLLQLPCLLDYKSVNPVSRSRPSCWIERNIYTDPSLRSRLAGP